MKQLSSGKLKSDGKHKMANTKWQIKARVAPSIDFILDTYTISFIFHNSTRISLR